MANEYDALLLGDAPAAGNDYDALLGDLQQQDSQRLKSALQVAAEVDPERRAKAARLAEQSRLPVEVVERNYELVAKRQQRENTDYDALLDRYQQLSQWLTEDPTNAALAQDDLDGLQRLHDALTTGKAVPVGSAYDQQGFLARNVATPAKRGASLLKGGASMGAAANMLDRMALLDRMEPLLAAGDMQAVMALVPPSDPDPLFNLYWNTYAEDPAKRADIRQKYEQQLAQLLASAGEAAASQQALPQNPRLAAALESGSALEMLRTVVDEPSIIWQTGVESAVAVIPGLLAMPLAGPGALGLNSLMLEYGNTLMEGLSEQGVDIADEEAVLAVLRDPEQRAALQQTAIAKGVPVALFDTVSAGVAGKILAPRLVGGRELSATSRELINIGAQLPAQGTLGAAGEAAGQLLAHGEINAAEVLLEGVAEVFGSGPEILSSRAAQAPLRRRMARLASARRTRAVMQTLGEIAPEVKLGERDPARLRELVQRLGEQGGIADLLVPVSFWQEHYAAQGLDPREQAIEVLGDALAYDEAVATGADLAVPMGSYVAKIAATADHQAFIDQARLDPLDPTNAAADGWAQTLAEGIQEAAGADSALAQSVEQVRQDILGQLAGIMPRDEAEQNAALMAARYRTRGLLRGMDPLELYSQHRLRIRAPAPEILQRRETRDQLDRLLDRLRAGDLPSQQDAFGPSLLEFLRAHGLQDDGGELAARDLDVGLQPGQQRIVRPGGLTLDHAAELAHEAGYLPERNLDLLLEAVDREASGEPVFAPELTNQQQADLRLAAEELERYLGQQGINLADVDNAAIRQLLDTGALPEERPASEAAQTFQQFAGPSAETADQYALAAAQEFLAAGADPEQVRQTTGWFQGMDGLWRFEIDDSQARLRGWDPASEQVESTSTNADYFTDWTEEAKVRGVPLGHVLHHPRLFAAYPQLSHIRVRVDPDTTRLQASYQPRSRTVTLPDQYSLSAEDQGRYLGVLLHEIQHAIQTVEGFAIGGSPDRIQRAASQVRDSALERMQSLQRMLTELAESPPQDLGPDDLAAALAELGAQIADARSEAIEATQETDPEGAFQAYRRLAGEIEARNVQARQTLTEGERRGLAPEGTQDIPPPEAIVVFNGQEMASRPANDGTTRDLIAQHNLTAGNLLHADRMGGLAVPSLAITTVDQPLVNFGEITLLGPVEMADPSGYARTQVFGADIYSPRYPGVVYEVSGAKLRALREQLADAIALTEDNSLTEDQIEDKGLDLLANSRAVLADFLQRNGIAPELAHRPPRVSSEREAALREAGLERWFGPEGRQVSLDDPAFVERAVASYLADLQSLPGWEADTEVAKWVAALQAEGRAGEVARRSAVNDILGELQQIGEPPSLDPWATKQALEAQLAAADLGAAFEEHVHSLMQSLDAKEKLFMGFTHAGNRRYKTHTLQNVVNILKKELRGGESFNYGVGSLRAHFTPRFKSLKQIRAEKGRLVSREQFETVKAEIDAEFDAIREALAAYSDRGESFGFADAVIGVLEDSASMGVPAALPQHGMEGVPEAVQRQVAEFLAKLRQLPTEYFEAKILRDVALAEFRAAVVPDNLSPKARAALAQNIEPSRTHTYKAGDDADRARVIGEAARADQERVLFQSDGALDQRQRRVARGSITFGADATTIRLLQDANLSTFLHESGHLFLEELAEDAQIPGIAETVQQDMATVQAWWQQQAGHIHSLMTPELRAEVEAAGGAELIRQVAARWRAPQGPLESRIVTEMHEYWARGFEAYLRGEDTAEFAIAPSSELRAAFARFRAWLVALYQSLAELRVNLTPEVRAVMDRLLATEQEIAAAEAEGEVAALFTDAEAAGMSEAEFATYRKTVAEASQQARQTLQQRLMAQYQRERAQWWKEARAAIRDQVEQELNAQPEYRALAWLATGKEPGGDALPGGLEPFKLDKAAIVASHGESFLRQLPGPRNQEHRSAYLYAREGGIHPDLAAERLGFASGDALLDALASLQPKRAVLEAETDARVVQEHGDLRFDGTIADAAREAVHGDQRSRIVLAELRALRRKQREVSPFVRAERQQQTQARREGVAQIREALPSLAVVRQMADGRIGQIRLRELQPHRYLQAARRSGREALTAVGRGDWQAAAIAKRRELVNTELYLAAVRAQERRDKMVKHLKGLARPVARERIGKGGIAYLEQLDALLERFEFASVPLKDLDERASLLAWYQEQLAAGFEPAIDPALFNEASRRNYRELTLDELTGIYDAARSIETLARRSRQLRAGEKLVEREQVVAELVSQAAEARKRRKPPKEDILKGWLDRAADRLGEFDADMIPVETLVEWLDGGATGPWHDYLFNLASAAQTAELDMHAQVGERVGQLIDGLLTRDSVRMTDTFQSSLRPEQPFSRFAVISLALNIGNESNWDKMLRGFGWQGREAEVLALIGRLDAADLEFVQQAWDAVDTLWQPLNELQQRVAGVPLDKVERRPVTITLRSGETVELAGGYYPLVYDPRHSTQGLQQESGPLAGLVEEGYARATSPSSHRKGRTRFAAPLLLDLNHVLQKHLAGVIKDLTHREFLIDANWLLQQPQIRAALQDHLGDRYERLFMPWLKGIANDRVASAGDSLTGYDRAIEGARSRVTLVALGYKATTMLAQFAGAPNVIEYIRSHYGSRYYLDAINRVARNPLAAHQFVVARSGEMRHRFQTIDRDIRDELRRIKSGKVGILRRKIERGAFFGIVMTEKLVSIPAWLAAYRGALAQGATEAQAIHAGDAAVRRTQGAGGAKDLNALQRRRGVMRMLTMFLTPFAAQYGRLRSAGDLVGQRGARYAPELVISAALITMLPAVISELLAARGPECEPGDTDCWAKWLAVTSVASLATPVPILRDIAHGLEAYALDGSLRDARFSPVLDAINRITRTTIQAGEAVYEDDLSDEQVFDLLESSGYLLRLPTGQVRITLDYLWDLTSGETEPEGPGDIVHGLLYRRSRDEQ